MLNGIVLRSAAVAMTLCCVLAADGWAQQKPAAQKPFITSIPANDSDLDQLIALAGKLKSQAAICKQCRDGGGDMVCSAAKHTAGNADDLRVQLYGMQKLLPEALTDLVNHLNQLQNEYGKLSDRNVNQKIGLAYSKFLSDSAKITLDVISLNDSFTNLTSEWEGAGHAVQSLSDPNKIVKNITVAAAKEEATLGQIMKDADTVAEAVNGAVGAANDIKSAHVNDAGFLDQATSRLLTVKGGLSDVATAVGGYRARLQALDSANSLLKAAKTADQLAVASAQVAKATKAAADLRKGLAGVISKVGGELADYSQGQLANEIANNEEILGATDKAMQGTIAQMQRVHQRQAKLQQAIEAMGSAAAASNGCASTCEGASSLQLIPEYPHGAGSYGDRLRASNTRISSLSGALSQQAGSHLCQEKQPDKTATGKDKKGKCVNEGGLTGNTEYIACLDSGGH